DARLADIADDARMVAVVAAMGGEIEGDRDTLLPRSQRLAIEGVGSFRGGEAGILADRPRTSGVHRRARPAHERLHARQIVEMADTLKIVSRIERLYRNAL